VNLQLALIGIGILVVVGIYFYSRWQQPGNHRSPLDLNSSGRPGSKTVFDRDEPSFGGNIESQQLDAFDADASGSDAADTTDQSLENQLPTYTAPVINPPPDEAPLDEAPPPPVQEEIPVLEGRVDVWTDTDEAAHSDDQVESAAEFVEQAAEETAEKTAEQVNAVTDVIEETGVEEIVIESIVIEANVDEVDAAGGLAAGGLIEQGVEGVASVTVVTEKFVNEVDSVEGVTEAPVAEDIDETVDEDEVESVAANVREALSPAEVEVEPPLTLPIDSAPEPELEPALGPALGPVAVDAVSVDGVVEAARDRYADLQDDLDYAADAEGVAVVETSRESEPAMDSDPQDSDPRENDTGATNSAIEDHEDGIDMDSDLPLLELEINDDNEGFSVLKMDDLSGQDLDQQEDVLEQRPSLKKFISSMKPLNRIKDTIQNKLESVKVDREKALVEEEMSDDEFFSKREMEAAAARAAEEQRLAALEPEESAVVLPSLTPVSTEPVLEPRDSVQHEMADAPSHGQDSAPAHEPQLNTNQQDLPLSPAEGFEKLSQIDYYVKLSGERDVSRESVLAIYREAAAGLAKNHSIYGLLLPEKVWRDLENEPEESRFGDLIITMQLVDQNGPVSEQDMTRFSSLVMKLSESTGRGFSFMAPIENAQQQAQVIDQFRQQFDSIFVVNIRPVEDEVFEGAVIARCAGQIGLTEDDNNFYARYKPVGKQKVCLYSLANMSDTGEFDLENMRAMRTRGVTFFTRPAVNRSPGAVFSEMVDAAKAFASRIKGEVIAPGYDDLSMEDVEAIRRSIEKVAREMESYGINPGSEEATRLF